MWLYQENRCFHCSFSSTDRLIVQGHNLVFNFHFRSVRYAKMGIMGNFENESLKYTTMKGYTLYTSLEPCPMGLVRLSIADISRVVFAAVDVTGCMGRRLNSLPPFGLSWRTGKNLLGPGRQGLINAVAQIFFLNVDTLIANIKAR